MSDPEQEQLVGDWLRYADEDLTAAARMLEDRRSFQPRQVCFSAQQAAEKAIKAVYVARQVRYPFEHDLEALIERIGIGAEVAADSDELTWLSQWARDWRYPGPEPVWAEAERAAELARAIMAVCSGLARR